MFDSLIFDLDGTFWDSTAVVADAWNAVIDKREDIAFHATSDNLKQYFGRPLPVIADMIFPELPYDERQALMDECNESEHVFLARTPGTLFAGVREALEVLSKKYPLYIVSNCESGYIEVFLEGTGLGEYFKDFTCPGDTDKYKAENIQIIVERNGLKNPVYIGDTMGDASAAAAAGVPFIFAAYGFGEVSEYAAKIDSFSQLPAILEGLETDAEFHTFDMSTWPRAEHFHYYMNLIKTRYNLNANIDITHFLTRCKERNLRFFPSMLHMIMRAVNDNKEFRTAIAPDGQVGYWEHCNPSYTIFHEDDKTFSDIWTGYSPDFDTFYNNVVSDMETYRDVKGIKAKPGRPGNFTSVSSLPWLSFSGHGCDTFSESKMILPILLFGKYFEQNGRILLPFSISVNHAAADGYHSAKLINDIQDFCNRFN